VADGWCWFVLREEYCWLVASGWFDVRQKYCWLMADKPSEQGDNLRSRSNAFIHDQLCFNAKDIGRAFIFQIETARAFTCRSMT
jgi:hypothetical protein